MAEGIRIVPRPELGWPGDAKICVTDHSRPIRMVNDYGQRAEDHKAPCPFCGKQHFAKTYHIRLRAGSAIVSTTIWANLQRLVDNPFVYANPVPNPPGQILTPNHSGGFDHEFVEKFQMPIITPRS